MKGIIFNVFTELVEDKFGLETLDTLIKQSNLENEGAYTSGGTYPDSDLTTMVQVLSKHTGIEAPELIKAFGEYMFPKLVSQYPVFVKDGMNLKEFLLSIHDVIHVEVNKLYPEAKTPTIEYEQPNEQTLIMKYVSKRKLCALSEGLIYGAAHHFKQKIHINHPICMHDGHDHCRLEVNII